MEANTGFASAASSWVVDHKRRILVNVSSCIMMVVICGVMGCFDFFSMKFDLSRLTEVRYWSHIFCRTVCLVCALNIGLNMFQPYAEDRNFLLQRDSLRYEGLIAMKEQKSFESFILLDFNVSEKKKAWVAHINKKINTLGRFAKDESRMLWGLPKEKLEANPNLKETKAKNHYCKKRAVYEEMKTDEWMDANIEALHVRTFRAIDPSIFDLSINGREKYSGYKLTARSGMARGAKTATSIMMMVLISIMITVWYMEIDEQMIANNVIGWLSSVLNALMDISFVLWQFIRGAMYATKLVEDEIHRPYIDRTRILVDYYTSPKTPVADFKAKDNAIVDNANSIVSKMKEEAELAKSQRDMAKLIRMRDDSEKRVHKDDNFGGKL